jgi:hypothetical protein
MSIVDTYARAATRENTQRSYRSALQHFETEWGGLLPASADTVARYLAEHAERRDGRQSAGTLFRTIARLPQILRIAAGGQR